MLKQFGPIFPKCTAYMNDNFLHSVDDVENSCLLYFWIPGTVAHDDAHLVLLGSNKKQVAHQIHGDDLTNSSKQFHSVSF